MECTDHGRLCGKLAQLALNFVLFSFNNMEEVMVSRQSAGEGKTDYTKLSVICLKSSQQFKVLVHIFILFEHTGSDDMTATFLYDQLESSKASQSLSDTVKVLRTAHLPTSHDRWGFCEWWPIQGAQQSRGISLFDQTSEKRLLGGCRAESLEHLILGAAEVLSFSRDGVPTRAPTFSRTYLAYLGIVEAAHAALMLSPKLPPKSLVGPSSCCGLQNS